MPRQTPPADPAPPPHRANLRQVVAAVFWSFLGIRKGRAMEQDTVTIKPLQVIVVGLVLAALLVLGLLTLVSWLTR